jgi:DsbC/DsbD-like thiol-disulfide interchange protein
MFGSTHVRIQVRTAAAISVCVSAFTSVCILASAANAQDASPWAEEAHSAVRLIAGPRTGTVLLGGIAFKLQPGWKTYWRTPGDSGVPPRFDFSASDNVEAVTVLWPAPRTFLDGAGGIAFGYKKQVVLPLRIVAKNGDKPVTLRGMVSYAVCDKTCIPVEAKLELPISGASGTEDKTLTAALEAVPKPARIGDDNPLTLRGVTRAGQQRMLADVLAPADTQVELFAEGPTPDWALPVPKLIERKADGVLRFGFDLDGLPPNTAPEGAMLKLTLVSRDTASGKDAAYEFSAVIGPPSK